MVVKILNKSQNALPAYETWFSAGVDLRANLKESIVIEPMERVLVPTGLYLELPSEYEAQVRPRSGLALKSGITVLNAPGTIDADYRGEVGVILINLSNSPFTINNGDRIAQMVFAQHERGQFVEVHSLEDLSKTDRGEGGFGHTGTK